MNVSGFYVTIYGDPSVGLFVLEYKIEGDFYFEDEEELNTYIIGLKDLHEQTFDGGVKIETFEQRRQDIINELNQGHDGYPVD